MNILLKYFGLIGIIIGLIDTFIIYKRIKKGQNQNNDEFNEENILINKFIIGYGICFTIPFFLLQIFQILGN